MPSSKTLTEQEFKDVHDTIVVLLAVVGDASVSFNDKVGAVLRRGYNAIRTENNPPLALLPYKKGKRGLILPASMRAMANDQYLKPEAPGAL